jgi:transposase
MKGWGKKFQYSIMGGIMSDIKNLPQTVVIDRFFPSTKLCPICGQLNTLTLTDRLYHCDCGYSEDRDIKSAKTILQKGIQQVVGRNLYLEEEFVNTYLKPNFNKQTNLLTSEAKLF